MDKVKKVWLVTGASKGLGASLVKKLLKQEFRVVATSRNIQALTNEFGAISDTFLPLEVSLSDSENVKEAIAKIIAHFGQLDIIVNNAGFGQIGTLKELTDEEARSSFDIHVFGSLNIIRHAMPHLRKNESGHIFNISSIGGFSRGYASWGIYCATKFAVAGFTESLAAEVKGFGMNATVVYPGYFRTDFLAKGSVKTPLNTIDAYKSARQSEQAHMNDINRSQPNDPEKAADVLIAISKESDPPVHFFLGNDAYDVVYEKVNLITNQVEQWKSQTLSTSL
ncbi:SDR family oxidoreductase [Flavobacterium sp. HJSW_4]|uniref:SDR family oxidoreductase n=1 Tax=Flavobacterium sp. HJSW_4 TaxID=3344660 RepID=UPI0035F3C4B4